jgi:hypothetical protein
VLDAVAADTDLGNVPNRLLGTGGAIKICASDQAVAVKWRLYLGVSSHLGKTNLLLHYSRQNAAIFSDHGQKVQDW